MTTMETGKFTLSDPDKAAIMLKEQLPGFDFNVSIDSVGRTIRMRSFVQLSFARTDSRDVVLAIYPGGEEYVVGRIVNDVHEQVIKAAGLETLIAERETIAFRKGEAEGWHAGKASGLAEGRRDRQRAIAEAAWDEGYVVGVGDERSEWSRPIAPNPYREVVVLEPEDEL